MQLYTSNRLETLLGALSQLCTDPLPPLQAEYIVVQSKGMERWLSLGLASHLGIWANAQYPFPRDMLRKVLQWCLPDAHESPAFEPDMMQWVLMRLLPLQLDNPAFEHLKQYLQSTDDSLKLHQLCQLIAKMFDQYQVYRPEWIMAWDKGDETHWQAQLWRILCADIRAQAAANNSPEPNHRAALHYKLYRRLQNPDALPLLPPRIHIFGMAALPPIYIELLSALSQHCEVHVFLLNPCEEFWGDIVSEANIAWMQQQNNRDNHSTVGNTLLASLGKQGRDFIDILYDCMLDDMDLFTPPESEHILANIQCNIMRLQQINTGEVAQIAALDDASISIHNCHSAMREVEVLHDQLLARFEADSSLQASDILVMMPDIETYAPLIQAVFATASQKLPFSIADRSAQDTDPVVQTLFLLLDCPHSRLSLSQVMQLLDSELIQAQFGLSGQDVEQLQVWFEQAGICWGEDENSREALDLPAFRANTWAFGLDRLLLATALPMEDHQLFAGILPVEVVEGQQSQILGRVCRFNAALFQFCKQCSQAYSSSEWVTILRQGLETFFASQTEQLIGIKTIRDSLQNLQNQTDGAEFNAEVPLEVIRNWLQKDLENAQHPVGFMTGQITFCALLPMRSIPFRVIALLGMNDRAYPRAHKTASFDLITQSPKKGDRSRRQDDRYLFLEALLSARDQLYISYVGQNIKDNTELPPSVLVSELSHYIAKNYATDTDEKIMPYLYQAHPLQAFSPLYFLPTDHIDNRAQLFSYVTLYEEALNTPKKAQQTTAFWTKNLPVEDQAMLKQVSIDQLMRFFRNPSQYALQQRLDLYLDEPDNVLSDDEPFELDNLSRYQLREVMLDTRLKYADKSHLDAALHASGRLPPAQIGQYKHALLTIEIDDFMQQHETWLRLEDTPTQQLMRLNIDGIQLSGVLPDPLPAAMYAHHLGKLSAKHWLKLWIQHLFLQAHLDKTETEPSRLMGHDKTLLFNRVTDPKAELAQLLAYYQQGLERPLPFFPNTSKEYADTLLKKNKSPNDALQTAQKEWRSGKYPEAQQAYYRFCFSEGDALGEEFQTLAEAIFEPILAYASIKKWA